jgi:hypothetical protein
LVFFFQFFVATVIVHAPSVGNRIIHQIGRLLDPKWKVKVCHTYREANSYVDALAAIITIPLINAFKGIGFCFIL